MNTKRVASWFWALFMGSAIPDTAPRAPVWKILAPFASMREFNQYRHRAREAAKQRDLWWGAMRRSWRDHPLLAQNASEPCDPALGECPDEAVAESIRDRGCGAEPRAALNKGDE